ncbi:MAG TPA: GGDEF and EAL domain-containing protein [Micropepsaceae bacterium]|nr:GGDEF and EAL domain-containing protein [Micropepsaceae bacterium]
MIFRALLLALMIVATNVCAAEETSSATGAALDFAVSPPVIDLGPSVQPRAVKDAADPRAEWFTLEVQNRSAQPSARVLTAVEPAANALALAPPAGRPTLIEAAGSDPAIVIERAVAFGENAFRVVIPAGRSGNLALHFENVAGRPALLAWTEPALIAHNRRVAVLSGLVSGLFTASMAFAAGAAMISARIFPRWAALFLFAVLVAHLTMIGLFDGRILTLLSGPYALASFAIALAVAAAIRVVDYIAPFEAFHPHAARWRDWASMAIFGVGIAAYAGAPGAALAVRLLALFGAAAAAGYLAHCGRIGIAAARRLAPAATIFALVTAVAALNALGFFGVNLIAASAIGGFAAAGTLLVALATAVPVEHSIERLREFEATHKHNDSQALITDEAYDQVRDLAAVVASQQGVFDFDFASELLSLSAEAAALIGLPLGAVELSRENWLGRIHPDDRPVFEQALETYRHRPGMAFRVEFRLRAGARMIWCELRATMSGQSSEAERCLGLIADVTARKRLETGEGPGSVDALTGLETRPALQARLEDIGSDVARASLAVFDLDRFKAVNDSLGRDGADVALAAFVERLENAFEAERSSGRLTLYRVGGDMFAALAFDIGDLTRLGKNVLAVTGAPFVIADREVYLTSSVGVASGRDSPQGPDLLIQAERAMIEAKLQGGGRVALYTASAPAPRDAVALEAGLRHALERGQIETHYQPIVRLADLRIAGFEALLRWRRPDGQLVEPETFVPHAEQSGLILPLGQFVLESAVRDLAEWQRLFPMKPALFVSVNVAWRQIADAAFVEEFAELLKSANIAKRSLKLEITESAVMREADRAVTALQRLRDLGVGLAVDDFGTGHSSLSHLRRFPFEAIKIDKSFIADVNQRSGATILRSIVALAHELNLAVVAEGIETEADALLLRDIGCEFGQGFLFGSALPADRVENFIADTVAQ